MSGKTRKILAVTGTRAEYGLARTILSHIHLTPGLRLELIVTGMHLEREFGWTVRAIQKDKLPIVARVPAHQDHDKPFTMGMALGEQVREFTQIMYRRRPDFVFTLTDLGHTLAAAIAGALLNIPVAHLHGGDVSGTIDESFRHATTKMSHLHFAASEESAQRIRRLGEEPWRVHMVGAPGLDEIIAGQFPDAGTLARIYGLDLDQPVILLAQHSVVQEAGESASQMRATLAAIRSLRLQTVAIYPNADFGREPMIRELLRAKKQMPQLQIHKSLPRDHYLGLMNLATVLLGNSSSGIIEAPTFGLPVVNVGSRQQGRQRAKNVLDVPHDTSKIIRALERAILDNVWRKRLMSERLRSPYGRGHAGQRVAHVFRTVAISSKLLDKRMTY